MNWRWLRHGVVTALHDELIAEHGGRAGIRDTGVLTDTLAHPRNMAGVGEPSVFDLAAAYASGIVQSRPFVDGNKRTGLLAAYVFLYLNRGELMALEPDAMAAVMALAAGEIDEAGFSDWLKNMLLPSWLFSENFQQVPSRQRRFGMQYVTFSRELASGGTEIARKVAEKLGYHYFDTEAIEQAAEELGFSQEVKKADEKVPSFFQQLFSSQVNASFYRLHSTLYELAKRGNAVFLGRGSSILLKDLKCVLRVRIVASLERRMENLVRQGYAESVATHIIQKSDREREAFVKFAYAANWDDSRYYDLVLNMDKLNTDLAVDTIARMARSELLRSSNEATLKSIEMMALNSRLQAAIIDAGAVFERSHSVSISVSVPAPGKAELTGWADVAGKNKAEEIVRTVQGVESLDNLIRVVSGSGSKG